ncbi:MAG: hypothetical protein Kow0010_26030 [Dehalococcoidia bacterium]
MVAAVWVAACGGSSESATVKAADLIPPLEDLGYTMVESGRDPFAPSELDMARALYVNPTPYEQRIIVIVYVQHDAETASGQFKQLVDAYANMPVGALLANPLSAGNPQGQPPANRAIDDGPNAGDERAWFRTQRADSQGTHVWSDVYRQGQVAVVIQVLSRDEARAAEVRGAVIESVLANLD